MPVKLRNSVLLVISLTLLFANLVHAAGRLSPRLAEAVAGRNDRCDSLVDVVVFLEGQKPTATFRTAGKGFLQRAHRIRSVTAQLKSYQPPHKEEIRAFLNTHSVTPLREHWVVPAFAATIPLSKLESLSRADGIRLIVENARLDYEPPVAILQAPQSPTGTVSNELALMNIPHLWRRGLSGEGRLICSFDTGVEQSHPALSGRWRGNHAALSSVWFSKVAPDTLPYDRAGHGTHTMGLMVGATAADSFGVAPDAEWIAAGIIDQGRSLSVTIGDIIEAFQWALNPDGDETTTDDVPDVILNSWGIPRGLFDPCDETFSQVIDNVEAAGVVTIFAAGNEGPDPMSLRSPADRAVTALNAFAVGAVDNGKVIAEFSARGPSSCDITQIKPEVVAPGVSIRSSTKGGGFSYMTGTSMAAPYVAGLVALIRQYNPNATVDQIKYAFLQATEDLGAPGEDNDYGHGFIDASRLLDYIPGPLENQFYVAGHEISDDGIAFPGESFGLQLVIGNPLGDVESVTGVISAVDREGITLHNDRAGFYFGDGGTTAMNSTPYEIAFDMRFYNGQQVEFDLLLTIPGCPTSDTLTFSLTVGMQPNGTIASHTNGRIEVSVSDFGQFGFAPGSIYNVLGRGFRFNGGDNLLYEAGIVLAKSHEQLSGSVRDEHGRFKPSDFTPLERLSEPWVDGSGGIHRRAIFADIRSQTPIAVDICQETISFDNPGDDGFLIVRYILRNSAAEELTDLCLGFMADFDLSESDQIEYDESTRLLYQRDDYGLYVGLVALRNVTSFKSFANGSDKTGFTSEELHSLVSDGQTNVDGTQNGDLMFMAASGPFTVNAFDSVEIAFALVGGSDLGELYDNAVRAGERFDLSTGANSSLPTGFELYQNYPNPFNPSTTISFALPKASAVSLDIYNVLGQKVKTAICDFMATGVHQFVWDASSDRGERVASGVYFYRLSASDFTQSRKMLLVK